ncbi:MAG: HAD hydrolase-like protein [Oscillospiraceae bacterium]|jgi:predicted HAD superfamily hydrolase|nr:HAD hydrolase-like protein [Oscillospiraceae bacterium]
MIAYHSEEEYICRQWFDNFSSLGDEKIVIYGVGKNTEIVIRNFPKSNIIGLMDGHRTGEKIFGKRVIDIEEVIDSGVKKIVIIAKFSNLKIIYRRFAEKARISGISVYEINGNRIDETDSFKKEFSEKKYNCITKDNLKKAILAADVVSFDIFDTLLMRDVLYPRDIFLIIGSEFAKKRIVAEESLYAEGKHPNIYEIYDRMEDKYSPETEIETELKHIHSKPNVCEFLDFSIKNGKKVFFTSDMYFPKEIISKFLLTCDIDFPEKNIIVSCDERLSKYNGLFEVLKKHSETDKILHIGDNNESDIEAAHRAGIEAFYLPNSLTMLEDSFGEKLLKFADNLTNRRLLGHFIHKYLDNPFLFSDTKGKFSVQNNYDMSVAFFAPLILKTFGFLVNESQLKNLEMVLLASRDGFIIEKIYNIYKEKSKLPEMKYFYISRSAAVMAYIENETDILYAANLGYSGSAEELLRIRFFLDISQIKQRHPCENDTDYILRHSSSIIKNAEKYRKNYLKYISNFGVNSNTNIGFFDFVSIGTCIGCLASFSDLNLTGIFVGRPFIKNNITESVNIETLFKKEYNIFENSNCIVDNYIMWENILTSPEPSLECFDDNGNPVFSAEDRAEQNFTALEEIHNAVLDYVKTLNLTIEEISQISPELVCAFFEMIQDNFTILDTDYFYNEKLSDKFCNREFRLERN